MFYSLSYVNESIFLMNNAVIENIPKFNDFGLTFQIFLSNNIKNIITKAQKYYFTKRENEQIFQMYIHI